MADSSTTDIALQVPVASSDDGWEQTSFVSPHAQTAMDAAAALVVEPPVVDEPPPVDDEKKAVEETPNADDVADGAKDDKKDKPRQTAKERYEEMQARFRAETKAFHDTRRAREGEQAELDKLRKEREAIAAKPAAEEKPVISDKPVWSKYEADGKSYDDFLDDRDTWVRTQVRADLEKEQKTATDERTKAAQEMAERKAAAEHNSRIGKAAQKYPDFLEVVKKNLADVPDNPYVNDFVLSHEEGPELLYHLAQHPDEARVLSTLEPSRPLRDAIKMSEQPIELWTYFAQNPQECDRLSRLHPASALMALGEITAQLKGAKNGSPAAAVSNAKPPTRPVVGARPSVSKDPNDLPFGPEFIKAENARDRERRSQGRF